MYMYALALSQFLLLVNLATLLAASLTCRSHALKRFLRRVQLRFSPLCKIMHISIRLSILGGIAAKADWVLKSCSAR